MPTLLETFFAAKSAKGAKKNNTIVVIASTAWQSSALREPIKITSLKFAFWIALRSK